MSYERGEICIHGMVTDRCRSCAELWDLQYRTTPIPKSETEDPGEFTGPLRRLDGSIIHPPMPQPKDMRILAISDELLADLMAGGPLSAAGAQPQDHPDAKKDSLLNPQPKGFSGSDSLPYDSDYDG